MYWSTRGSHPNNVTESLKEHVYMREESVHCENGDLIIVDPLMDLSEFVFIIKWRAS